MDYAELPLPRELDGLVAAVWTASVPADAPEWTVSEVVPDGNLELIRRHAGRSFWMRDQPPLFAAGLCTRPVGLRLGAGARFTGVKLWPWAWQALGGPCPAGFVNDWIALGEDAPAAVILPPDDDAVIAALVRAFADIAVPPLGRALMAGAGVGQAAQAAGIPLRRLQRHFAGHYGMPPRAYLRLLRLRGALAGMQADDSPLADTAAAQGYADQAHMARDFRTIAGIAPSAARARARGPFV
ncbi:helix-turn-helix domain-containing protein [Sphingomonas canadensis]|uniref:Helix-turn-helix domain-containing protein n=1 Tax=Sphingomonas canadensis TaxID=1219257 RepID=A0ABW3H5U9_9SPHN|nr:helix-turn-helix domain-containing protein [Sphingomonas canadensis]MCW3836535.1 helix-turn-helix domain-containing protein [Sphingomonas canadensis]